MAKTPTQSKPQTTIPSPPPSPNLNQRISKLFSLDVLAPILVGIVVLMSWEFLVWITKTPPYLLPKP
ncbi:MAG: ABC transporter permease, partial [Kamptonema sp. SIO4C4]|nr:ABC transporter permease [Kamptonema sp. SIO4C4]